MTVPNMANTNISDDHLSRLASRITIEHLAYAGVAILAGVLRLTDLGLPPLSPHEAGEALAVWNQWQPDAATVVPGSPAYFSVMAFLTQVTGFSDAVMRLVPALFGFALVLMPWFLRHRVGRLGALLAALLLAISPLQIITSRSAGGQAMALFAGLLCFIAWLRYQESGSLRWFYTLAPALALGLTSAPLFFGLLTAAAFAWLAQRFVGPPLVRDADGQRAPLVKPSREELRTFLIIGLAALLALATAVLLALRGLGAAADLLAEWIGQFQLFTTAYLRTGPFAVLVRYEVGLLLIGLPAAIWAAVREKPFPIFLVYWALAALLLMLVQPSSMTNVLLLTLPGYLLVGRFANDMLVRPSSGWWWAAGLGVLFVGAVLYLNLVRYARLSGLQGVPDASYNLLIGTLALIAALGLLLLLFNWDSTAAIKGLVAGLLALLLVFTWGTAWWLSREATNDTRERWTAVGTDDDIRLIRETIEELSWRASNSVNDVAVTSAVDTPALRWYLRDFDNASFADTLPTSTGSPIVITPLNYDPLVASNYVGAEYGHFRPDTVHNLGRIDALRWWLFRQSPIPVSEERLVLWLRSDIAQEGS